MDTKIAHRLFSDELNLIQNKTWERNKILQAFSKFLLI